MFHVPVIRKKDFLNEINTVDQISLRFYPLQCLILFTVKLRCYVQTYPVSLIQFKNEIVLIHTYTNRFIVPTKPNLKSAFTQDHTLKNHSQQIPTRFLNNVYLKNDKVTKCKKIISKCLYFKISSHVKYKQFYSLLPLICILKGYNLYI